MLEHYLNRIWGRYQKAKMKPIHTTMLIIIVF